MGFLSKFSIIKFDKKFVPEISNYSEKSIIGLLAKDPVRIALLCFWKKELFQVRNRKSWLRYDSPD